MAKSKYGTPYFECVNCVERGDTSRDQSTVDKSGKSAEAKASSPSTATTEGSKLSTKI